MILNISAYRFVTLTNPENFRSAIEARCLELELKGTVLLGTEGINLMLAGAATAIQTFEAWLQVFPEFNNLLFKESESSTIPFKRLKVRIKNEIIAMHTDNIDPIANPAPYIAPATLKTWLDEHRDLTLLDTRNQFEVEAGAFESAIDLGIQSFRQFPQAAAEQLSDDLKSKPVVMMCTGGIRCEKAAIVLQQQGFKEVYQLDGGILEYFKACKGAHYRGNCVVFDERVAVTPELQPIG